MLGVTKKAGMPKKRRAAGADDAKADTGLENQAQAERVKAKSPSAKSVKAKSPSAKSVKAKSPSEKSVKTKLPSEEGGVAKSEEGGVAKSLSERDALPKRKRVDAEEPAAPLPSKARKTQASGAVVAAAQPGSSSLKEKKNKKSPREESGAAASATLPAEEGAATALASGGPSRLDRGQITAAVRALQTHVKQQGTGSLLDDNAPIQVSFATVRMPKAVGKARACKPVPLALPYPYISLDTTEICLITKDPQRPYKDKLAAAGLKAKVIGVSKLKKKFHPYEAKRQLCAAHELFLADAAVLPILPPLLGKTFFKKRRLPTAVNLSKQDIRAELQRAACGTVYRHAQGTSNSVQVGVSTQPPKHLVENTVRAVEQAVSHISGGWSNILSLSLKTTNSVALPFYNSM